MSEKVATYNVIGLMSGTSLDGLDIAYCTFDIKESKWFFNIEKASTVEYSFELLNKLRNCTQLSGIDLSLLDIELGRWIGKQTTKFIKRHQLKIDLIASHGHTVFHQPKKGFTLQIGSGQQIQQACGTTVINDFRSKDVSLGGQGAPLVPIGDQLLFSEYSGCLNLGGIANISFQNGNKRIAYDIVPVNMVLNKLSQQLGQPYDKNGDMAKSGDVNKPLLDQLNELTYYRMSYPKSLGYEWVKSNIFPLLDKAQISIEDQLATFVEHAATQIASALPEGKTLITGGGVYNLYVISYLNTKLKKGSSIEIPNQTIVEFKEAMIFALLGTLRHRNEVNCLSSVTGAQHDCSGGVTYSNI